MRHIIPISGKDSLCTALVQTARDPSKEYEYFFNDVNTELPETYDWLDTVEDQTGWEIKRIGKDLEQQIEDEGILPSHKVRYCTRKCKIKPMEEWIGEAQATIYYGLRADEDRAGFRARTDNIKPTYPLQDLSIDLRGVWTILEGKDLLPPDFFWPALHRRVVDLIGPEKTWRPPLQPWERHVLFAGRSRSNCYFCFYQRQYEYLWLYDTHPDLFERACEIESETGGDDYTWRESYSLAELPERRDEILDRRARAVARKISKRQQVTLFEDRTQIDEVSCGLHCGK